MTIVTAFLLALKYIAATILLIMVILAPAWIAQQTKKDKTEMAIVRISSWLLCWTGLGWFVALFRATKK